MNIRHFCFNLIGVNTYLAWNADGRAVVVDPGFATADEKEQLYGVIRSEGLTPEAVLLTHAHFDHIMGLDAFLKAFVVPVYMHQDDVPVLRDAAVMAARFGLGCPAGDIPTTGISDGGTLLLAGEEWKVISTPGHTPGSVCYHIPAQRLLFSGDTLFRGSIGRTDLPLGDYDKEIVSIMEKLMGLDSRTEILPGHGPFSSIADERTDNPFLVPFNEKEESGEDLEGIEINPLL